MTRQPKLPKPVEAWALCNSGGIVTSCFNLPVMVESPAAFRKFQNNPDEFVVRVRIVPIKPKTTKRAKRKEKKK